MKHNYNESMLKYYKIRVNAMSRHIRKLEGLIAFYEAKMEINQPEYEQK